MINFNLSRFYIGFLFILFANISFSYDELVLLKLSEHPTWINQLQYRKTILGGWKSEANEGFFLSPNGKVNPLEELKANLNVFLNNPERPFGFIPQPVICAFPTRKMFLEKQLNIQFDNIACIEKEEWLSKFKNTRPHLIFSDSFANNPASMFGHTFILFSKNDKPDSAKGLLDYAINFSADTYIDGNNDENPSLLYIIRGLFGFFPGRYRVYKFYQMESKYISFDSRDLWYLDLKFDENKTNRLLEHIWEIFTTTSFDYYFFDRNCSFRLLSAFDYADPSLDLVNEFYHSVPLYYVSPLSTYRRVSEKLKTKDEYYSPSSRKKLNARIRSLSEVQKKDFDKVRGNIDQLNSIKDPIVIDTLVNYFDYQKKTSSTNFLSTTILTNLQKTLETRSKLPPSHNIEFVQKPGSPLDSHLNRAGLLGFSKNSLLIGGRASYHDLLNDSTGYDRWSELTALDFKIDYNSNNRYWSLNKFLLVNIKSFFPLESFEFKPSWEIEFGYDSEKFNFLKGGIGLSAQNFLEQQLFYFFISPVFTSNKSISNSSRLYLEARLGTVLQITDLTKIHLSLSQSSQENISNITRFSYQGIVSYNYNKNLDFRFSVNKINNTENFESTLLRHF